MGVAALMIVLCHAPQYGVDITGFPRKLLVFLNIGVDIFLFLSGMGCCFSLMKPYNYFPWLKRRFIRILIPYTIIMLTLRIASLQVDSISWHEWFMTFSTLHFWTRHIGIWYIALLVLLYPLTPLFYQIFETFKRRELVVITFIILLLLITHIPVGESDETMNSIITNLQWAFKRVVSFIIGMYLAPYIKHNLKINALLLIGTSALGCILFHFFFRNVFYAWLYVLPLLIIITILFKQIPHDSKINIFFLWLGAASLESYLANVGIKTLMPLFLYKWIDNPIFTGHYLDYTLVIIAGLCLTYIAHRVSLIIQQ